MMFDKKGQMHVEVVISFVIFVGFVFFLFLIFNPFNSTSNSKISDFVFNKIDDSVSIDMNKVSLSLVDSSTIVESCFSIGGDLKEDLGCVGNEIVVRYLQGDNFLQGGASADSKIEIALNGDFYEIVCAPGLNENPVSGSCQLLGEDEYDLGIITERNLWSAEELINLRERYLNNYQGLKESLDINEDFGIIILPTDDSEEAVLIEGFEMKMPSENRDLTGVNVFAKTLPVDVLMQNGEIVRYRARVFVW